MNMIEVDPKLFIKCRLCLDETGHYQIVPKVQKQIKYSFDIDVEPFDGLPQLICKKCESILSQYAGIKQIFQEKQKNLKSKLSPNIQIDNIVQQQQDTVSSTQTDNENKQKPNELKTCSRNTPVPRDTSSESLSKCNEKSNKKTTRHKNFKNTWQNLYAKQFVCRFCSKSLKDKKKMNFHVHKQCKLHKKYSSIVKSLCLVELNKIGSKSNFTGSQDNVVCNENKIIQSKAANYYVLYTQLKNKQSHKENDSSDSSESSDEDFPINKRTRKRRRLISRSSNETVVIEQNIAKCSDDEDSDQVKKTKEIENKIISSDVECVNIEDSDSASTKSSVNTRDIESETPLQQKTSTINDKNDKMINNIITTCSSRYMNRLNGSESGNSTKGKEESSLKHKILSIGRKIIHSNGINATGLLRYMEHKNLEIVWVPKMDTKVSIKTRSKESRDNENSDHGWEKFAYHDNYLDRTEDFVDIFERVTARHVAVDINGIDKQHNQAKPLPEKEKDSTGQLYINRYQEVEMQALANKLVKDSASNNSSYAIERKVIENSYLRSALDSDRKLLNANPVANPKQLPKKMIFTEQSSIVKIYSDEVPDTGIPSTNEQSVLSDNSSDTLHNMPIITSTVSLAPAVAKEPTQNANSAIQNTNDFNNSKPPTTTPKIKVKPVTELMSDRALSQQNNSFVTSVGWALNNETPSQNIVLEPNNSNMVFMTNGSTFTNINMSQNIVYYSQIQDATVGYNPKVSVAQQSGSKKGLQSYEYVKLHTVELPNMRTESPYKYFQKLLGMHNMHLLESVNVLSAYMVCLTKFKVLFEQEKSTPVGLCLFLYCEKNMFCIKAQDYLMKELDIAKFSANWQWEILKVFKGDDLESKVLSNAAKYSSDMQIMASNFINLLKSIVFSRESL